MVKNPPANVGDSRDAGLIPGSERTPGVGNSKPLQDSCLENSMEKGAWRVEESDGLQSMGPRRIRHNWVASAHTLTKQNGARTMWTAQRKCYQRAMGEDHHSGSSDREGVEEMWGRPQGMKKDLKSGNCRPGHLKHTLFLVPWMFWMGGMRQAD